MAKNSLSDRLQMTLRRITGKGSLTEKDIDEMMREVRLSLLEADVNFKVVKKFCNDIKEKSLGEDIIKGLNPGQQVVKIVFEELKAILGNENSPLKISENGLTTIMTIGLQGSGKTTSIGKLSALIRKKYKKKVMVIAADIYRPAAIDQLVQLGKQLDIFVFEQGQIDARKIVENGLKHANINGYDVVIIDTAGRLHIDEQMMQELVDVKKIATPGEILLTIDAMTGQDAANVAKSFHEQIGATGAIITKLDGDTRGGAALSVVEISNIPIKFASSGEKMDSFEVFYPDRIAQRILGMGDMLTFIDEVTANIDEDEAAGLMEKMSSGKLNYNDLLKQFKMMKKMGSISRLLGFIPGINKIKQALSQVDDTQFYRVEVIIKSMTEAERRNPDLVEQSSSRRKRIAAGCGMQVSDVNKLRDMLESQKAMGKKMGAMSEKDMENMSKNPQSMMDSMPRKQKSKGKGKGKGQFRVK